MSRYRRPRKGRSLLTSPIRKTVLAWRRGGVAAWRARMVPDEAKAIYKNRAATAECVNAQSRNRGLQQFRVRGLAKVRRVGSCSLPWLTT